MKSNNLDSNLFADIKTLISDARSQIIKSVNTKMVYTYFGIGRLIVKHLQRGKYKAEYGKQIIKNLSTQLSKEFGKGFSTTNLEQMRFFYETYSISQTVSGIFESEKSSTLSGKLKNEKSETVLRKSSIVQKVSAEFVLSWSHYVFLMRIDNIEERKFYEIETFENNWSIRELKRQFDSALYERLALSRDKKGVKELSKKGQIITTPQDMIKDPYILEFLGLPENSKYSETELENSSFAHLFSQ